MTEISGFELRIIQRIEKISHMRIGPEAPLTRHLANDLAMDSLDMVELVIALEDEFGIQIDDGSALEWATVGDVTKAVREIRGGRLG